ncbi:recombinase family protein [Mixta sp.]|uniref:recombinase family protein n=1 Tax=Mixta sp. TaxID=2100765 RepID=UPI002589FC0C|nr:recombinase family protein [Mixta sp.]MCR1565452.1 recombinase family protein [Mixta sp.]
MPQLFSYIRWSSSRQDQGTTKTRQLSSAKAFAKKHNLEMSEIYEKGVSAYRGKHADAKQGGKLGLFLKAVEEGVIPSDSWLYVENLDRIHRGNIDEALELFIKILRLGLTIVTGMDERIYTRESIRKNYTDLIISITLFSRSNEESNTKRDRVLSNVEELIKLQKKGKGVNIKAVGRHVFWVDDTGSSYEAVVMLPTY